jgi:hypothetical protein
MGVSLGRANARTVCAAPRHHQSSFLVIPTNAKIHAARSIRRITTPPLPNKVENWWQNTLEMLV